MAFIKNLYHDEIRDGWFVKSDLKKCWERQLEIWAEVDRICRKYAITYWAAYGTLLGAARHGGFIPWDEDIDFFMMRPDYDRFCAVLDDEIKGGIFELNQKDFFMTKIIHSQTTSLTADEYKKDFSHGIVLDVFALDIVDDGTPDGFFAFNAIKELVTASLNYSIIEAHLKSGGKLVNDLVVLEKISALPDEKAKNQFIWQYVSALFNQSSLVNWLIDSLKDNVNVPLQKAWFSETIYLPFELVELPAPKMFDEVLTSYYGDWRTPIRDGRHRLGTIFSADIPWREFLRQVDPEFFSEK